MTIFAFDMNECWKLLQQGLKHQLTNFRRNFIRKILDGMSILCICLNNCDGNTLRPSLNEQI